MLSGAPRVLFHEFDRTWPPALVEERIEQAVHVQDHKPPLTKDSLNPVAALDVFRGGDFVQRRGRHLLRFPPPGVVSRGEDPPDPRLHLVPGGQPRRHGDPRHPAPRDRDPRR